MVDGRKLRNLRKEAKITKEQLGQELGVGPYKIEEWEQGESEPDQDMLITLTKIFDCTLNDLFDDKANEEPSPKKTFYSQYKKFPYPIVVLIIYLCLGAVENYWHPGWILFLTIPLYYTADSLFIPGKSKKGFCYPVLALIIYLLLGFYGNLWDSGWIIFVTIPLYYGLVK